MDGDELDDEHHVARYCSFQRIINGLPSAEAFVLRKREGKMEEYLSVNWLECFDTQDLAQAIDCVRQVFRKKGFRISSSGKFVSLQVRNVKDVVSSHSHIPAQIIHKPGKNDPSYCRVLGYTGHSSKDKLIALKIARLAHAGDMYPGRLQ